VVLSHERSWEDGWSRGCMEMEVACRSVQLSRRPGRRLADLLLVTNAHAIPWHVYYVRWLWELLLCHAVWLIIFFPLRGAIPDTSLAGTGTIHTQHTHIGLRFAKRCWFSCLFQISKQGFMCDHVTSVLYVHILLHTS
jgi:hypothetical protein